MLLGVGSVLRVLSTRFGAFRVVDPTMEVS
jgi:hypothetical protein